MAVRLALDDVEVHQVAAQLLRRISPDVLVSDKADDAERVVLSGSIDTSDLAQWIDAINAHTYYPRMRERGETLGRIVQRLVEQLLQP